MKKKHKGALERKRDCTCLESCKKGRRRGQSTSFQYRINSIGNVRISVPSLELSTGSIPDECLM